VGFRRVPKRIVLQGDRDKAATHIGEADSLLNICQQQAKFQNLNQHQMVRTLQDGTVVVARSFYGLSDVRVLSPVVVPPKPRPVEVIPPSVHTQVEDEPDIYVIWFKAFVDCAENIEITAHYGFEPPYNGEGILEEPAEFPGAENFFSRLIMAALRSKEEDVYGGFREDLMWWHSAWLWGEEGFNPRTLEGLSERVTGSSWTGIEHFKEDAKYFPFYVLWHEEFSCWGLVLDTKLLDDWAGYTKDQFVPCGVGLTTKLPVNSIPVPLWQAPSSSDMRAGDNFDSDIYIQVFRPEDPGLFEVTAEDRRVGYWTERFSPAASSIIDENKFHFKPYGPPSEEDIYELRIPFFAAETVNERTGPRLGIPTALQSACSSCEQECLTVDCPSYSKTKAFQENRDHPTFWRREGVGATASVNAKFDFKFELTEAEWTIGSGDQRRHRMAWGFFNPSWVKNPTSPHFRIASVTVSGWGNFEDSYGGAPPGWEGPCTRYTYYGTRHAEVNGISFQTVNPEWFALSGSYFDVGMGSQIYAHITAAGLDGRPSDYAIYLPHDQCGAARAANALLAAELQPFDYWQSVDMDALASSSGQITVFISDVALLSAYSDCSWSGGYDVREITSTLSWGLCPYQTLTRRADWHPLSSNISLSGPLSCEAVVDIQRNSSAVFVGAEESGETNVITHKFVAISHPVINLGTAIKRKSFRLEPLVQQEMNGSLSLAARINEYYTSLL
jgi:hypothetical protein